MIECRDRGASCKLRGLDNSKTTLELFTHFGGSTRRSIEELALALAVGTHKSTHVFNDPNNWNIGFDAEVKFFSDISKCHLLRGSHDNGAVG